MKIRLLAMGSRTEPWVRDGFRMYQERLPATLGFELVEVPLSIRSTAGDPAAVVAKEAERLIGRLKPGDFVVALDERGRQWTSQELARELEGWINLGRNVALVIGGPEGLGDEVRGRADRLWSLSPLTFPHGLVRVLVAEQLYRAWSILSGHPYHRA